MIPRIIPVASTIALFLSATSPNKSTYASAAATVYSSCTTPNTVAFTFNNGPHIYMNEITDQLDRAGAKGTFFVNGDNYDCIYNQDAMARIKYAYSRGHQIASHTWGNKDMTTLTRDQINDEMSRVEQALQRITGANPAFMRPPFGSYNQLVLDVAGDRGQSVTIWDFDTQDQAGASADVSKALVNDLANRHPSTALVLAAETVETTVRQVLPYAISELQGAGYKLVTLAECLGLPAYQSVGPPSPGGSWKC